MEDTVEHQITNSWLDLSNIKDKKGKPLKTKTKTELLKICLENHKEYGLDSCEFCNNFVFILKKYVYDKDKKVYTEYPLADKEFCNAIINMLEKTNKDIVKQYAFSIFMSIFLPEFHGYIKYYRIDVYGCGMIISCLFKVIVSASRNFCDLKINLDFMQKLCKCFAGYRYEIKLRKSNDSLLSTDDLLYGEIIVSNDEDDVLVKEKNRQVQEIDAITNCYISMLLNETDKLFSDSVPDSQKAQCWFDIFCSAIKSFFDTRVKALDRKNATQLYFFKYVFKAFLIQAPVTFKKQYCLITYEDIKNLINIIAQCFPSDKNIQSEMILYLFWQFDFFKDFAGIKTDNKSHHRELLDGLYNASANVNDVARNEQIDKIKNLYLGLLSYRNDPELSKKKDKKKAQFYFDKFMFDAKNLFANELKKHKKNKQGDMPPDFQLSLKFVISMAMDIKTNASLLITYEDIFTFADIIYKYFPSNKDIQNEMILYLFEQFDIIKDVYRMDNIKTMTKLFLKSALPGRKLLLNLDKGNYFNFNDLLPEVLLQQVNDYNSENGVIGHEKFNLQDQVFEATDDIWEKLGQILQWRIIKNTKNNDLKFLNLSTVFGFLHDKKFNVYDYIVKLEELYSYLSNAILNILVDKFKFEKNTLANNDMKQIYTKIIKDLALSLFKRLKSLLEEESISIIAKTENTKGNNENENIVNEINIISDEKDINGKKNLDKNRYKQKILKDVVDKLLSDIVDIVLKKFGSLYGFICEFNKAVVPRRDGSKILGILNFVIDFIFDKDKGSRKSIASLLIALLNQIDWSATLKLTNVQKKEILRWVPIFCMMVFTCTKFLDCETNIYRKKSLLFETIPELKITSKLINNLKQIMFDKNFIELANDFGVDKENLSKIKSFLYNISNLKVEDCLCILYLTHGMPKPEQNLDLIFDLAKKFHEEYEWPTVQITLNVKKNKIKIIDKDKDVFDIMNKLDEVKKVDNELAKSADIELKTFIWTFQNQLQFLFEETNLLLRKSKANLVGLLVCSYTLFNLLKFVCDDRFGNAIIKEISNTDISKNRKKDEPSWTGKWVSVFENLNKIFDKCEITDANSIFFDMNVGQTEDSKNTVDAKYGIYTYIKNILDVLKYFSKQKIKLCPKENDDIFNKFKNNLEQFCKCMTKAVANGKKTWNTSNFEPKEKKNFDCIIAKHIAETYKSFDNMLMKFRAFYEKSSDKDRKIISMKQNNLFNYFRELWTWLDFTFGTYNFYSILELDNHDDECCWYCKKFDNISLVINYIYENRVALKKSDSNDDLLVAMCSVKKLLDKVAVRADKKITLKDLKKRLSDIIYYFRYLKDPEKERDENESLKSNVEKNQINGINDDQNKMFDGTKNEIKINEENKHTNKIVSMKNNPNVTTFENKNIIHDQINIGVNNGNNKIPNEQSKKRLDNNIVNGDNITDVKDNKKCETSEINKNKNEIKNDIVIENQNSKNRTIENKNNDYQQKDEVDLKCVETKLVVCKPNQFLKFDDKKACFNKTKALIPNVITYRKTNMDNKIIKDLPFKKNQSGEVKQTKDEVYANIENKIENNVKKDVHDRDENKSIKIKCNKTINISITNNENEKQNGIATNNIDNKNKIKNNNTVNPKTEIKNNNENERIIIDKKSEKQNDNNEREKQNITYTNKIDTKKIEDINNINNGENNDKSNNKKEQPTLKIPNEDLSSGCYISKQTIIKNIKNGNEINDKKISNNHNNLEKIEQIALNKIKVDINEIHRSSNNTNLNDINLKIDSENEFKIQGNNSVINNNLIKDKGKKTSKNNIIYNINVNVNPVQNIVISSSPASNEINSNSELDNTDNTMKIYEINKNKSQTIEQISSNNTGNDLKKKKLNQNPNQKNLCFVFIFVGIVFFIIAVLFLTNIIWTWFVINFIAQLAIMIFSVVLGCICIFTHKSLRKKLSSWQKQKYQNQMIPKINVSYNQHKKMDDRETNSNASPKSEETDRVCPFCFFWK